MYSIDEKKKLMEEKEQQIRDILMEGDITFGMARSIVQRIEAGLLREGDTYLMKTRLTDVSPSRINAHH